MLCDSVFSDEQNLLCEATLATRSCQNTERLDEEKLILDDEDELLETSRSQHANYCKNMEQSRICTGADEAS